MRNLVFKVGGSNFLVRGITALLQKRNLERYEYIQFGACSLLAPPDPTKKLCKKLEGVRPDPPDPPVVAPMSRTVKQYTASQKKNRNCRSLMRRCGRKLGFGRHPRVLICCCVRAYKHCDDIASRLHRRGCRAIYLARLLLYPSSICALQHPGLSQAATAGATLSLCATLFCMHGRDPGSFLTSQLNVRLAGHSVYIG